MDNKIILIMIVKNESHIIQRCIKSAFDIIDGICICDTGSTDTTISVVNDIISKSGKPGKIHQCEFKNFGYNRTKSFEVAFDFINELKWDPEKTFGLLMDADMVLKIEPPFKKNIISEYDGYKMMQIENKLSYYNTRLIRMSIKWKCIGVTHELWCINDCIMAKCAVLNKGSIWIDDISDGGCKSDKFERDIKFLLKGIEEEPLYKSRYYYYLGQSYFCIKDYHKAIEYFKKRIDEGGFDEETWFTYFMIARSYFMIFLDNDTYADEIEEYALKAYNYFKFRSEPILLLVYFYIELNNYEKALEYINIGITIPQPENQLFYMDERVYKYEFFEKKLEVLKHIKNSEICDLTVDLINRNDDKKTFFELLINNKPYYNKLVTFTNYKLKVEIKSEDLKSASLKYNNTYIYVLNDVYMTLNNDMMPVCDFKSISHKNNCISIFSDYYTSHKEGIVYEYGKFEDGNFIPIGCYNINNSPFITSSGLDFIETLSPFKLKNSNIQTAMPNIISCFNTTLPGVVYNDSIWLLAFCYINSSYTLNIIIKLTKEGIPQSYTAPFYLENQEGIIPVLSFTLDQNNKGIILYHSNNFLKVGKVDLSKLELKTI